MSLNKFQTLLIQIDTINTASHCEVYQRAKYFIFSLLDSVLQSYIGKYNNKKLLPFSNVQLVLDTFGLQT